jgi:hypothetical protein
MITAAALGPEPAITSYRLEQGRFSRSIFADKERNVRRYLDVDTMRERADVERIATWIDTLRNYRDTPKKRPRNLRRHSLPSNAHE